MTAALQGLLQGAKGLASGSAYEDCGSEEGELDDPMLRPVVGAQGVVHAALPPGVVAHGAANLGMPIEATQEQAMTGHDEDLAMMNSAFDAGQLPLKEYVTMKAMLRMPRRSRPSVPQAAGGVGAGLDFSNGDLDPDSMIHGWGVAPNEGAGGHPSGHLASQ